MSRIRCRDAAQRNHAHRTDPGGTSAGPRLWRTARHDVDRQIVRPRRAAVILAGTLVRSPTRVLGVGGPALYEGRNPQRSARRVAVGGQGPAELLPPGNDRAAFPEGARDL